MKLYALLLLSAIASCLLDGVMATTKSSSITKVYFIIGGVVLVLAGAAVFLWLRNKSRHKKGNAEDPPYAMSYAVPRSTPAPYSGPVHDTNDPQPSSAPINQIHGRPTHHNHNASPQRDHTPHGHGPSPVPKPRARPINDGAGGVIKGKEPSEKSRQVAARVLTELQADPTLVRQKIPYSALYFVRVLSKGAFGEVWLAQLENRQVAIKRILNEKKHDENEIVCFASEIKLMASFHHPKIVEFVGVSWNHMQDLCAVTEYMSKGDLHGFLRRKNGQLNWSDHKIYLVEDVADALGYLHALSPAVIHRDLKSKNILLDDSFRAKLSDFGISRERSLEETMTAGVGTIYWTAPEVLMGRKYTERADIFSFGICMSEIDTHEVPYSDIRDETGKKVQGMRIVQMVIRNKIRPTFAPNCPLVVRELAMQCLAAEPDQRPDAFELLRRIQAIQQHL